MSAPATRDTKQKRAIRAAFLAADRPLNPEQVREIVSAEKVGLGIATVYRNIKQLLEEGWLTIVQLPGENAHFEVAGKAHHHHFHCKSCKKVFELMACLPNVQTLAPAGFLVSGHELLLYGTCETCARA